MRKWIVGMVMVAAAAGCGSSGTATSDSGTADGGSSDAGRADGGSVDAGAADGGLPVGATCTVNGDCASGICLPVVIQTPPVCVGPCGQQSDCAAALNTFCEPIAAGSDAGYCIPRSPAHCLSCVQNSDCGALSEVCFQAPGDVAPACHIDCSLAGAAACPPDYTCTPETVGGAARQLCRPTGIPDCLDALGGYCDRLNTPQPCARQNDAGSCTGQRTCSAPLRFTACNASAPQCLADCSQVNPPGCNEVYCPAAISTPDHCGSCNTICPGYLQANDNVTCVSQACTFSCQGENYDVDANPANGCEAADAPTGNHTQATASSLGSIPCAAGMDAVNASGKLLSDARLHANPAVVGFDAVSGSAPDWFIINATGGAFCTDTLALTLLVTGSASPICYQLVVITNKATYSCQASAAGNCSINQPGGAYSDNTNIYLTISKTCSSATIENVNYTVTGTI